MSSMLEQAIVDAAALREAALKNAEQSLIEKYAPQIKEAVDSLLEKEVIEEQDVATVATSTETPSGIEAPIAASPVTDPDQDVTLTLTDDDQVYEFDLESLKKSSDVGSGGMGEETPETTENLIDELGLGSPDEQEADDTDALLQEIFGILSETEEVIEEEITMEMPGKHKNGTIETNQATLKYQEEMQKALDEVEDLEEENNNLKKEKKKVSESLQEMIQKNQKLIKIIKKLDNSLSETLLSNAKLLYCNQTLSDASLNERQKSKIVEAIAKAKTPEEAKNLHEALKTTVGTTKSDGPKSLSESVSRKSNLSGIMPRRKQPEQEFTFADKMKKLAGIK
jgi:hypothetical protein